MAAVATLAGQEALEARLAGGCDRREAVAEVARGLRLPKREVYRIALSLNDPAS